MTRDQFDKKMKEGSLRLAFIGMSNVGKSYRAKELEQMGNFKRYSVDNEIKKKMGFEDMSEMADWMGFPYEEKFKKNEGIYLKYEGECTKNCLDAEEADRNFVLDTTGSAIYQSEEVLDFVQKNFLILTLQVPDGMIDSMTEKFFEEPKSVVWGDLFNKKEGESDLEAVRRNYPLLLAWRQKRYEAVADIMVDVYTESKEEKIPYEVFLEKIRAALPTE